MDKVVLITVTYNSSHLLARLLEYTYKQSHPVYKIVIVDNASKQEHKENIERLSKNSKKIVLIESETNLGGGGGFQTGIQYVLDNIPDADWIWIVDDDAFPEYDCLEKLLAHKNLENAGMLCPVVRAAESKEYQLSLLTEPSKYMNRYEYIHDCIDEYDDITEIEIASFVGPLVKKSIADKVGTPDGSLFLEGDDTEYTYRITRCCRGYLIKDAIINHRDFVSKKKADNKSAVWKIYYPYRNRILFIDKYSQGPSKKIIGKLLVIKNAMGEIYNTINTDTYESVRSCRIKLILKGIYDGLRGIRGKRVNPDNYR